MSDSDRNPTGGNRETGCRAKHESAGRKASPNIGSGRGTKDRELVESLASAKSWSCIFLYNDDIRLGTSKAPFKAAERITALLEENAVLKSRLNPNVGEG